MHAAFLEVRWSDQGVICRDVAPLAVSRFLANMSSNQAGVYRGGNTTGTTGTSSGTTGNSGELRNTTGTAGTGVISAQRGEPVCDQKYYTKVRDRRSLPSAAVCSLQCSKGHVLCLAVRGQANR